MLSVFESSREGCTSDGFDISPKGAKQIKTPSFSLCALLACCGAIAACSQSTALPGPQTALNDASERAGTPPSYNVVYSFRAAPDGHTPAAGLIKVASALYGTTSIGGRFSDGGTFFSIAGFTEKVLHSFGHGTDGIAPRADLIDVGGTLYGTTLLGGTSGQGTIFSIAPGGKETVVYSFGTKATDGAQPVAGLINVSGTLYGTTYYGGKYGLGTVFSIIPKISGSEAVLHSFGNGADGAYPRAELTKVRGTLYGTTAGGGGTGCSGSGCGTVFRITTKPVTEHVLYSFRGGSDGAYPFAGLINVHGALYGTTEGGGIYSSQGTVFRVTTKGIGDKVLHSFGNGTDGIQPEASLTYVNGTLYGTTFAGGRYYLPPDYGGTVFSITPSGSEKVLHSFGNGSDGTEPAARLKYAGTLIGTTQEGGDYGFGTVFALTP